MKKIKWALIGCGNVVLKNKKLPFINTHNTIVAICTTKKSHSIKAIEKLKLKNCNGYSNVKIMLKNEIIDAIYICTPPKYHYEFLKLLSNYNIPVIYVEKPYTINYKESKIINKLYANKNTKIFVAHYKRLTPQIQKLNKIIKSNKYGQLQEIKGIFSRIFKDELLTNSWIYDKNISGGGRFFDIAPHIYDILYYIFGNFSNISSNVKYCSKKHNCETFVKVDFFIKSIPCNLTFNLESNQDIDLLYFYFENYTIITSVNRDTTIFIYNNTNKLIKKIKFKKIKIWGKETIKAIDKIINNKCIKTNLVSNTEASIIQKYIDTTLKS